MIKMIKMNLDYEPNILEILETLCFPLQKNILITY